MPQTKPIVDIVNVVASASVDQKIDLIAIIIGIRVNDAV